jgi:hypothetical protein
VVGATLGYAIADIRRLYERVHHAEDTVQQIAASALARYVGGQRRDALQQAALCETVSADLGEAFAAFGFSDVALRITDFAYIRAIRLVSDRRWGGGADTLNTSGAGAPH